MARTAKTKAKTGGRPTKLSPAVQAEVCEGIKRTLFRETAAICAGITSRTLRTWEHRGNAEREAGEETEYTAFVDALEQAEAELEDTLVQRIWTDEDWRRVAWVLERRSSRNWLVKQKLDLVGPGTENAGRKTGVIIIPAIVGDDAPQVQESNNG